MTVGNSLTNQMGSPLATPMTSSEVSQTLVAKEQARIQGQVFMAKQFPRDMTLVMNKIEASCERPSLAEISEYEYPRGGQKITGASIRLLEVVAQCYGNVSYSWKELVRDTQNHKSTVLAYAWDLETNLYSELEFDVPHYRQTKSDRKLLEDDRDIYELVANQASRRVRRCLENVVPRDIVDDARRMCNTTLNEKVDWKKKIDEAITYFEDKYAIKPKQIEEYFGMSRAAFTKNTYLALQRIFVSVRDGMVNVNDVFPKIVSDGKPKNSLKSTEKTVNTPVTPVDPIQQDSL